MIAPPKDSKPITANPAYLPLMQDEARNLVGYGGAGSGKSHAFMQRYVAKFLQGHTVMGVRKVGATLEDSMIALCEDVLREHGALDAVKHNKTRKEFHLNGARFMFRGLDDPEKIKSVHGLRYVWREEATEFTPEDDKQLRLRLRGKIKGVKLQHAYTFNPIEETHWLKAKLFDNPPPDTSVYHSTYHDNIAFLDEEYVAELERLKDEDWYYYQVYCLGKWGSISNAKIFRNVVVEDFPIDQGAARNVGGDWGFNDPAAFTQNYIRDQELYIFWEYYKREKVASELIQELAPDLRPYHITADSSEPGKIKDFQMAGFRIMGAEKPGHSIRQGIDYLKRFKKIHIHKTNCPNTAREFLGYKYREVKRNGEIIVLDDPLDKDNHAVDATRYSLEKFSLHQVRQIKTTRRL